MQSVEWRFFPLECPDVELVQMQPFVDGRALTELVSDFERSHKFKPAGGYAGLVLSEYRFGDLRQYLRGKQQPWPGEQVPLLGCDCGEWGCWPLIATVRRNGKTMSWTEFEQPFSKERDYSEFGPFTFDLDQYIDAVASAATNGE